MKKLILMGVLAVAGGFSASADVSVNLPANSNLSELEVSHYLLTNLLTARNQKDLQAKSDRVQVSKDKATIALDPEGPSRYRIMLPGDEAVEFYAAPEDDLIVNISSITPLKSSVEGTPLMEGMTEINEAIAPMKEAQKVWKASGKEPSREQVEQLYSEYVTALTDFIDENPTSPAVCYALLHIDDEDFEKYANRLPESVKGSYLYPFVVSKRQQLVIQKEKEQRLEQLQSGNVVAPDFTLDNTEGKKVSLSDFKGKWVILDFWGSWCVWCVRGFPELKDAYAKYKDVLEVIGIDCKESKEAWLAGVRKYELPWVNVYCPDGNPLFEQYGIQGFPTKAIIDPEGKIRNITVGHDPEFFTKLAELIGKK